MRPNRSILLFPLMLLIVLALLADRAGAQSRAYNAATRAQIAFPLVGQGTPAPTP